METIIAAIGSRPAGDGLGSVVMSALTALAVMALIYGVLELMNHVNKKKNDENKQQPPPAEPQNRGAAFSRVLAQKIKQRRERENGGSDDYDKDMRV